MQFKSIYRQVFAAVIISFTILMGLRVWLYFLYPADFATLNSTEALLSFLMGFRVDMSTLFTFLALPILMALFPVKGVLNPLYRKAVALLWSVVLTTIIVVIIGDILYFSFVHRHLASELSIIMQDMDILTEMAKSFYLTELIVTTVAMLLLITLFLKIFAAPVTIQTFSKRDYFKFFVIILVLALGIRQHVTGRSFGIPDAFVVSKSASGNLAMNGFFSVYRSHKGNGKIDLGKMDVNATRRLLDSPRTTFVSSDYPLMRRFIDAKEKPYNVMIILLESWSARFIDSYAGTEYGVTPNFDRLARESLKFTNFYANGQRSIEGVTAMFAGITQPTGLPNIGWGLELNNLSYLGGLAKKHGYTTMAMQSSGRRSFRLDSLTSIAGFDEYYGSEDMPDGERESKERKPKFGTWDGNMFRLLHEKLNGLSEPFMSFAFTSTTHSPFYSPGEAWEKYPHDVTSHHGYFNTLYYADMMLGEFFDAVKKEPWFDNTVFILTADHTLGYGVDQAVLKTDSVLQRHHIPLLIYAPKVFSPRSSDLIGSQSDIFPTVIDMLGWDDPFASTGQSLFDKQNDRQIFYREGNNIGLATPDTQLLYNGKKVMDEHGDTQSVANLKKDLLTLDQTLSGLITQNRWSQP